MKHIKIGRPLPQEKNDCTVLALSTAMEIHYMEAYGLVLMGASRKHRHGVNIIPFYDSLFPETISSPGMIVENFIKYIAHTGNWIVQVRGHVFAVINGVIHDIGHPEGNLKRHVVKAWRVK